MTDEEIKALQDQIATLTAEGAAKDAALVEAQAKAARDLAESEARATHATEHAEALGKEIEALTSQLAAALETAASEKARADRGDMIMQSAALAVPAELIAVRAAIVRKQQESAQAAADTCAAELARLGG